MLSLFSNYLFKFHTEQLFPLLYIFVYQNQLSLLVVNNNSHCFILSMINSIGHILKERVYIKRLNSKFLLKSSPEFCVSRIQSLLKVQV